MQFWLGAVEVHTAQGVASAGVNGPPERFSTGVDGELSGLLLQNSLGSLGEMLLAGVALVALGLTVVAVWRSGTHSLLASSGGDPSGGTTTVESNDAAAADSATESPAAPQEPESAGEGAVAERPDREVIIDILGDNEGRMKQAKIVDETGWSKSKVSMLLSDMEDSGDISKLRVGRENIVSLSGYEPEAAGSPFEDE